MVHDNRIAKSYIRTNSRAGMDSTLLTNQFASQSEAPTPTLHSTHLDFSPPETFDSKKMSISVVIPCYKVTRHIHSVISAIGPEVSSIYCIDDNCPDSSGDLINQIEDRRLKVLYHKENGGVGAATISGFRAALNDGADIVVKLDGDGQMDPSLIPLLIRPILSGDADFTKGNRFYSLENLEGMPPLRILGNAGLSFLSKLSTGYWNIYDPTNGFLAIDRRVLQILPIEKLSQRFFFESDMLFRLNTVRAVVVDVPMKSRYGDEESNLSIAQALYVFAFRHFLNMLKRLFYNYFLRDFSIATLELLSSFPLILFGTMIGLDGIWKSFTPGHVSSPGYVMLAAFPILLGVQLLLAFLNYDITSVPRIPISKRL